MVDCNDRVSSARELLSNSVVKEPGSSQPGENRTSG